MRFLYSFLAAGIAVASLSSCKDGLIGGSTTTPATSMSDIDDGYKFSGGFTVGAANSDVYELADAGGGKMYATVLEGTSYNGTKIGPVCRINADGSLDASFNTIGSFANGEGRVQRVKVLKDGHIAVAGIFRVKNAVGSWNICVLNPDGSLDASFDVLGDGPSGAGLFALEEDAQGRILTGGDISYHNGVAMKQNIFRYNRNGSLDTSFHAAGTGSTIGFNGTVKEIRVTSGGQIWVGGRFATYGGVSTRFLTLLNADGSRAQTFSLFQENGYYDSGVNQIEFQKDGKMVVGGSFYYNKKGISTENILRLNTDGSLDSSFHYNNELRETVTTSFHEVALNSADQIIVGGDFPTKGNIAMLKADGSIESGFTLKNKGTTGEGKYVDGLIIDSENRIYIAGTFKTYEGRTVNSFVRLRGKQ